MTADSMFSIRLSLQVAVLATALLALVTIPLAWQFARHSFRGKRALEAVFSLPLVLPPTVLGYYLVALFGRRGDIGQYIYAATGWTPMFSWWGALIAGMVVAFPLLFHASAAAFAEVDPALEQIAGTFGASRGVTFRMITLPLARNGLLSGLALAFARAMGEFGATMMVAGNIPGQTSTMPLSIYNAFSAGSFEEANRMALIYLVFSAAILWSIMRWKKSCRAEM